MNQTQEATIPGIVVLSSSLQVLFMNRRAMTLLDHLEQAAQGLEPKQALPAPLHKHCEDIIEILRMRLASNNWEHFHQYRVIGELNHQILLKGFGLPDRRGLSHCRILMLLSSHPAVSIPGIDRMKSPGRVPQSVRLGSDSLCVTAE